MATAIKRISRNELFKLEQKIEDVDEAVENLEAPVVDLNDAVSEGLHDALDLVAGDLDEFVATMEATIKETTDLEKAFRGARRYQ